MIPWPRGAEGSRALTVWTTSSLKFHLVPQNALFSVQPRADRDSHAERERLLFINDSAMNMARKDALRGRKEAAANSAGKSILLACRGVIIAFCFLP